MSEARESPLGINVSQRSSGKFSAEERQLLRESAARARVRAQEAAIRCLEAREAFTARVARFHATEAAVAEREAELRARVGGFVHILRALETPPERAVMLLKEVIGGAVPPHGYEGTRLMEDAVRWGIVAYYAEGDAA